jgi:hypothetical protein
VNEQASGHEHQKHTSSQPCSAPHPQPTGAYSLPLETRQDKHKHAKRKTKAEKMTPNQKGKQKAQANDETSKRGIDQVDEEHADSKVAKVAKVVLGGMADPLPAVGNRLKDTVYNCDGKYKRWNGKRLDPVCNEYEVYGCETLAQNGPFCKKHGGGKRCASRGCNTAARGGSRYCFAHGGGKRCCKNRKCNTAARGSSQYCRRHMSKKQPRCNTSARGAAVAQVTAPAAKVEKAYMFQEVRTPRVSALDAALERAELIAADAMTMLNPFLVSLQRAEDDALDALMELDTRTPPGGLVGDAATAFHMLVTLGEATRGVKVENAQTASTVDTTALTWLAETASEIDDMSD